MSEIDAPSKVALQTGEGATRVTRASTTSDDSSTQQQSSDGKTQTPKKPPESKEKTPPHETAVTLSTSLSTLEVGSRINAEYQGIDGQGRPLIVSESGTYVVKYDPRYKPDIDKIPQGATLEVRILKVERDIEARLIYTDPAQPKKSPPTVSLPVTLELTGLGSAPPKVRLPNDPSMLTRDKHPLSYQATELYRAENIARESAHKLKELPLPATTTNYTLFERAVPSLVRPTITRSSLAGNALIAQEQVKEQVKEQGIKTPPSGGPDASLTSAMASPMVAGAVPADALTTQVEKLLHKNTLATVIKNIPRAASDLPEIVRKHFAATTPLDTLKAGSNFTLRIDSIAIPELRPNIQADNRDNSQPIVRGKSGESAHPLPEKSKTEAPPSPELSGIIIAPGQHILKATDNPMEARTRLPGPRPYPGSYNPLPLTPSTRGPREVTLYVATPVSVIKFQSPIDLKPGTVINFSLPKGAKGQVRTEAGVTPTANQKKTPETETKRQDQAQQTNQSPGWIATSLVTNPAQPTSATLVPPPQPLENFVQNWNSLSQIISTMPLTEASPLAQSLTNRIPGVNTPGQMSSSMMFFFAALGAKNPARVWLGPAVSQQLEKAGQGKLLTLLDNDMQRIFRLGADTPPGEWRPTLVPLQMGGEVSAVPLLTRQVPNEDADGQKSNGDDDDTEKNTATRFIVELDLTQFGQIQIDGLLKQKKLNIIIRSKIILPSEMKQRIGGMFTTALEISGFSGDLQFRDNVRPDISVQHIINQKIHMFRP